MVLPAAGVIVGVLLVGLAIAVVQTLEGIFKAALYDYATGSVPAGFDLRTLANAYAPRSSLINFGVKFISRLASLWDRVKPWRIEIRI